MGDENSRFQLQWLERKTTGKVERWVSQLGRNLSFTCGQMAERGLRRLD